MHGKILNIFAIHAVLITVEGLSLGPASDLTRKNFTLVCNLEGVLWTSPIQFTYGSNLGGGCGTPPNPTCGSSIGTITASNDQIITLSLSPSNIANIGEQTWTCSHGSTSVNYAATLIAVCTNESVIYEDDKLELSCSCGYPNVTATVEYLDDSGKSATFNTVLQQSTQTGNCSNDGRAVDYNLPKPEIVSERMEFIKGEICAAFKTQTQYSAPERKCIPVDCRDPLLYGLLPVILIVLLISIITIFIMIFKLPEKIHEKLGDVCKGKILIIILFNTVAIGIGLALGLGLRNGQGKCDNWGLALGLSFLFGVLLSVILIISILCKTKKGNEDDGVTSDRSNGDRARSPASASAVKVTEKK